MATDIELKLEGMSILLERLGIVEAERFVALIQREKFDYTHWRENLWENKSVQELSDAAMKYRNTSTK
jgi:hypothetical protein